MITGPNNTIVQIDRSGSVLAICGCVEQGDQRGRTLGYPTANLSIEGLEVDDGVFVGVLQRSNGTRHLAAVSVGIRPTFYRSGGARLLEAYVLDFDDDLYGEKVVVEIVHRLRGQRSFSSREALVAQLAKDVLSTRWWQATLNR